MSVKFDFTGKVIALTGGASGIGLETARLLVASGAKVSIADVQKEALDMVGMTLGKDGAGEILTTVVDVSDAGQVREWIKRTVDTFGKLDGAANLAGVTGRGLVTQTTEELDDDDWAFVISVNLTGVMYCMREQLRNMNDYGSLVNASSFAGIRGYAKNAPYVASKHGVVGLTRSAAKEVGPERSIRVNAIAPGLIDTPMLQRAVGARGRLIDFAHAIKRTGSPVEVAELVAWLLSDSSKFISGTVQCIDGGWAC